MLFWFSPKIWASKDIGTFLFLCSSPYVIRVFSFYMLKFSWLEEVWRFWDFSGKTFMWVLQMFGKRQGCSGLSSWKACLPCCNAGWNPSYFTLWSCFLLIHSGGQQMKAQVPGSLPPGGWAGWNPRILPASWPNPGCCGHLGNEPTVFLPSFLPLCVSASLSLSLFLSLSPCLYRSRN